MMTKFNEHSEVPVPEWLKAVGSDSSWHNDAMPHAHIWVDEEKYRGVEVWVNYDEETDREVGNKWEILLMENLDQYHNSDGELLYSGEDEAAAIEGVNRGLAKLNCPVRVGGPIAGVWTPWAEALCRNCHDQLGPDVTAKRQVEWPADEKREGDGLGLCTKCGRQVWVREDVAQLTRLRALAGGHMEQTGGMCAALVIPRENLGGNVVVTNLDSSTITIGQYWKDQWEEGLGEMHAYCIPGGTPDEAAAAVIKAALAEKLEATQL